MAMRSLIISLIAGMSLAQASQTAATGLNEIPFEDQVKDADIVVIAKVANSHQNKLRLDTSGQLELKKMRILRILKGKVNQDYFELVTKGEVAELRLLCCKARNSYLLLLKRGRNNIYESVNGRYSVIVLP